MRPIVVAHYLGMLLALLGALMLVPLAVSIFHQERDQVAFLVSAVVTASVGGALWFHTRKQPGPMVRRESFLVVALAWLLASAFGALPYMLAGTFTSYVDAYFEAMSGFTATGSTVLTSIEAQPEGILFWRGFTQWLGGIGIVALFLGLMPLVRIGAAGAAAMYEDEVAGPEADRMTPRIRDTARALWRTYLVLSLAEIALLVLAGMPLFDAVTNTFGTIATGGFSPRDASIAHYESPAVEWIITVFMVFGGVNFALYYFVWRGKIRRALTNTELRVYVGMLAGLSLLVALDLMLNGVYTSAEEALRLGTFEVVSQQTGTGFVMADYDRWPWFSKSLILVGMFVGASAGSTCGALKVVRLVILAKYAHRQLYGVFHPRVIVPLKMGGRVIPEHVVRESVAFFIVYQSVFLFSTLAVTAMGIDFVTALSGVAATVGNVGPGMGLVGPTQNYASMPDLVKIIFAFGMFVGRLEFWTVLILLQPAFWRRS